MCGMTQHQKLLERETCQIAVRLSKADYAKIQRLVEAGLYRSSADLVREAVRDKLGTLEVVSVRDVDLPKAERMIEEYLVKHPGPSFASEIADALGLDYSVTFKIVHKLLEEGRIKKAKA
jgi:Arc/MetJ-type ribon-helix-helix transcriptional regulator